MELEMLVTTLTEAHQSLQWQAVQSANLSLVARNWLFGYYIVEFEQSGAKRAQSGRQLLPQLAQKLKLAGVSGCSVTNLNHCRQFYLTYSEVHPALSEQSLDSTVFKTLSQKFCLSWTHYQILMSLDNPDERRFYEIETAANQWSTRELQRQIASTLFERLALSRDTEAIKRLATQGQLIESPHDVVKDPYVLEFLDLEQRSTYSEQELETAIINKLEQFLLELSKGFLFEARQKRFSFENDHFYVDLVFYNRLLRCYVLIDLKLDKLTHQDLGQMQMYVNYFDRHVKLADENPTVGIVLCKRKNDALVELTLPQDANIFASKYQLYLPTKAELQQQIQEAAQAMEQ